jgi:hypothetical protein
VFLDTIESTRNLVRYPLTVNDFMDLGIIAAIVMLVFWGVGAFAMNMGGWIHLLLTIGVTLLMYRIVARGTRDVARKEPNAGKQRPR